MADNKKVLEFDRLYQVADTVACYCVMGGVDYHFLLSDLITYVSTGLFPEVVTPCPASTTTNINLGAILTNKRFELQYIAKRGAKYRLSTIVVISDGSSVQMAEYPFIAIPSSETEDLGISFTCNTSSGQARLNVIVDDAANDVSFKHILKSINL